MYYEEIDYNGRKLKIKKFNYNTPEGRAEYVSTTHGSIDDETFAVPRDLPLAVEDGYVVPALDALKRFQELIKGEGERTGFMMMRTLRGGLRSRAVRKNCYRRHKI